MKAFHIPIFLLINSIIYAQELQKYRNSMAGQTPPASSIEQFMHGDKSALNKKIVLMDFWATWCGPCIEEFPKLNKFAAQFKNDDIAFVSITYEPQSKLESFFNKHDLTTVIGIDPDFSMFRAYGAYSIPMIIVIDTQRKIILGELHPEQLDEQIIRDLIAGKEVDFPKSEMPYYDPEGAERFFKKSSGLSN